MNWPSWPWGFDTFAGGLYVPSLQSDGAGVYASLAGEEVVVPPTAVDVWLVQLVYEVMAAESRCAMCGAPLGRRLRIVPSPDGQSPSWCLLAATRCRGWRRHRHLATVAEASMDISLGPFRPRRSL